MQNDTQLKIPNKHNMKKHLIPKKGASSSKGSPLKDSLHSLSTDNTDTNIDEVNNVEDKIIESDTQILTNNTSTNKSSKVITPLGALNEKPLGNLSEKKSNGTSKNTAADNNDGNNN